MANNNYIYIIDYDETRFLSFLDGISENESLFGSEQEALDAAKSYIENNLAEELVKEVYIAKVTVIKSYTPVQSLELVLSK